MHIYAKSKHHQGDSRLLGTVHPAEARLRTTHIICTLRVLRCIHPNISRHAARRPGRGKRREGRR